MVAFNPQKSVLVLKRPSSKAEKVIIVDLNRAYKQQIDSVKSVITDKKSNSILFQKSDSSIVYIALNYPFDFKKFGIKAKKISLGEKGASAIMSDKSKLLIYSNSKTDTIKIDKPIDQISVSDTANAVVFSSGGTLSLFRGGKKETIFEKSRFEELTFSEDGKRLYFGAAPEVEKAAPSKDPKPLVHIWNWKEERQFTSQVVDKERDKKRTDLYVSNLDGSRPFKITNDYITEYKLIEKGNSEFVLLKSDFPGKFEEMWTGRPLYDVFLCNTMLERTYPIANKLDGYALVSPKGNYLFWYNNADSSWYTADIRSLETRKVTNPKSVKAYDEDNDTPDLPASYSFGGWSEGDKYLYVYDKYDIWRVSPNGSEGLVRITNGRERGLTFRFADSQNIADNFVSEQKSILSIFNQKDKSSGFAKLSSKGKEVVSPLIYGQFMFSGLIKSKSNAYVYSKESFELSPDLYVSDNELKSSLKVSEINPQQGNYNWGTAELVEWTSLDGKRLQGVVYKPQNFNPSKKYPMIVNFYEKNSETLYSYRTPEPHRSTIDYHMYTSNEYIVFNPDIVYREGYPGESAYNCIMPGISMLIEKGFVDEKKIGAQGHSWGGYQTAYLATRTSLFAAIESGAPVVNMFSAYGGIRWGTGLNRSFQYEHQQSRIAGTPWNKPLRYLENSPLFFMDKVTTPILIMHNDNDGHVPWYQGIEFFVSLKRLQKPVWMLNYTGEIHWPQKLENKIDFQIRMKQFFDHYLKGEKAPDWMITPKSLLELESNPAY
ncbi:MAG: prolyl oligopeptidase family serine peptidase [Bacteroidales bacterium]